MGGSNTVTSTGPVGAVARLAASVPVASGRSSAGSESDTMRVLSCGGGCVGSAGRIRATATLLALRCNRHYRCLQLSASTQPVAPYPAPPPQAPGPRSRSDPVESDSSDRRTVSAATTGSEEVEATAEVFRTLGMARRLQIMQLFVHISETLCGCEIADILELEDYQVSRDLSALRKAGLVESQKRTGTWIHYQVCSDPSPTSARLLDLVRQLPLTRRVDGRLTMRLAFRERAGCVLGVGDPEVLAALDRATNTQLLTILD
ncbi:MAG: transcriptional regulator [Nitriliruptor sp.]|nr:MAG: transcriptional regulator [Nitriliruptor sp.]